MGLAKWASFIALIFAVWVGPGEEFPMTYYNWSFGEPNGYGGKENCVHVSSGKAYAWNDVPCGILMCTLCQYDPL